MYVVRCAFAALIALSLVTARPAMLLAHAGPAAEHGCAMHMSHDAEHSGHHCNGADAGSCCDDCLCACAVGTGFTNPVVNVVVRDVRIAATLPTPDAPIRAHRPPALFLPPPLGPPIAARS